MHDHRPLLINRIERTLRERIIPAQTTAVTPLELTAWTAPEQDGVVAEPVTYEEAMRHHYEPMKVGDRWGPTWATTWIKATAELPALESLPLREGDRLEAVVDLGWFDHSPGFQCEGLVRDQGGKIVKAINPRNQWIPVPQAASGRVAFTIEAAANPLLLAVPPFQKTYEGDKLTSSKDPIYRLTRAEVVILHHDVYHLALDLGVLREIAETKPEDDAWGWKLWLTMSQAVDALDLEDIPGTAAKAREILRPVMQTPAEPFAHRLSAIGHAHIDSAWLWPIRETRRKSVRTLANVVRLIEDGSGLLFALPAAQHAQWVKELDPALFERIKQCVADGSIVPVGAMWIEPDAVLPGGEAMCRQIIYGTRFFAEEFAAQCQEIWLPDSFGYSAAIPQIARLAGINRFLTQKISWNQVDKFPHHTLRWEGIDGSRIFTHFPPVDTYGAEVTGHNVAHAEKNFKDKGRATCSLMPFGYGDGGGGPTREMVERINRFEDLRGAPKIVMETPKEFFDRAEADYPDAPVWVGELYLELHRGTFTSQIATKQGNRRSESLLREAELWAALAATYGEFTYPYEALDEAWKQTLLCQFHDILPGTSVAWAYREVAELYRQVKLTCEDIIEGALAALAGSELAVEDEASDPSARVLANATSFPVDGVAALGAAQTATKRNASAKGTKNGGQVLENEAVEARFDADGYLVGLLDKQSGRQFIPAGTRGGELFIHQDFPNMWDAWDLDPFYRDSAKPLRGAKAQFETDCVRQELHFGNSRIELTWRLTGTGVALHVGLDWAETEKILKLAFPVDIHTDHAQYETQMGYLTRPTHENTSWEAYKFEVSCHRWLRLADASTGLAIVNDATYGWDVSRACAAQVGAGSSTYSVVRASLARAAQFPDPQQDQGWHEWNFRIVAGATVADAIAAGQALNIPPRPAPAAISSPVEVTGAVVESVALAPDRSGDLVIRIYEGLGGRSRARVRVAGARELKGVDLLYRDSELGVEVTAVAEDTWEMQLGPFQIATLRATVAGSEQR